MATDQLLFDRTINRPRRWWLALCICLILLCLPFAAAALDGSLSLILHTGLWQVLLAPVCVSVYILVVGPPLVRVNAAVVTALLAYEQRPKEARTWPDNTSALRTLFFSGLIPLATVLARLFIEVVIQ